MVLKTNIDWILHFHHPRVFYSKWKRNFSKWKIISKNKFCFLKREKNFVLNFVRPTFLNFCDFLVLKIHWKFCMEIWIKKHSIWKLRLEKILKAFKNLQSISGTTDAS